MHNASIGIDLGKTTFHLVALGEQHKRCPESDSPLRGRIHLRRLSLRPTSNLLQSGGGPYIERNDSVSVKPPNPAVSSRTVPPKGGAYR